MPSSAANLEVRPETLAFHKRAVKRVIREMRRHVDSLIEEHSEAHLDLNKMAEVAYMSTYHFNRTFRRLTGIPPCQFLSALRLEASKKLVLNTSMRITDICFEVGYSSLGTFTRRFTSLVGVSPGQVRQMAQSPAAGLPQRLPEMMSRIQLPDRSRSQLEGRLEVPADFRGLIFVGLFKTALPAGFPAACAVVQRGGRFQMDSVPEGRFHLLAAGMELSPNIEDYLLCNFALRGGGQRVRISRGRVEGNTKLSLRPPVPFDPPILLGMPMLLAQNGRRLQADQGAFS